MNEITYLSLNTHKQGKLKSPSLVNDLNLFLDKDGLLRVKTRIQNKVFTYDQRNPILLNKDDSVVKLIIKDSHESKFHSSITDTINNLRNRFWIPKSRVVVKNIINNCPLCRALKRYGYKVPISPPLPNFRIQPGQSFLYVGCDLTGHFFC